MACRWASALALLCVLVSSAHAVEDLTQKGRVAVQEAGVLRGKAATLNFDAGDFDVTCTAGPGICNFAVGPNVLVDGGGQIGSASDFATDVDLSTKNVFLPNALTDRTATCTIGQFYLESDDVTVSKTGTSICRTTDTWAWLGDIVSGGLSGGQTIVGGTGSGDDLILQSTSHATRGEIQPQDSIQLLPIADNPATTTAINWNDTFTNTSGAAFLYGFSMTPTVTMAGGLLIPTMVNFAGTWTASAAATNSFVVFNGAPTIAFTGASAAPGTTWAGASIQPVITSTNVAAGTMTTVTDYAADDSITATGASGSLTVTNRIGYASRPTMTTNNGTGAVTVTTGTHFLATPTAMSGAGTETLTNEYGFKIGAVTSATNFFPFAAVESAITGTVASGEGIWGVETGAPNRFYFKNESGHIWRTGYLTSTGVGTGLATTATTKYFPFTGNAASTATANGTDVDQAAPGAITVYGATCGLTAAAGAGTDAHALTLMDDTATTTITCTITTTASTCNVRVEAGVSVAAPSLLVWRDVTTDTPVANDVSCVTVYNLGAW